MTLTIKTPTRIDHWVASDSKTFRNEEDARVHEVFLAVNDRVDKDASNRYGAITELARHFDFVPRGTKLVEPPVAAFAQPGSDRCRVCNEAVFGTTAPSGAFILTCVNGHDNGGLRK